MFPPPTKTIFIDAQGPATRASDRDGESQSEASALARLDQVLDVFQPSPIRAVDHLHDLVVGFAAVGLVVELTLPDHFPHSALAFLDAHGGNVARNRERRIAHDAVAEEHLAIIELQQLLVEAFAAA